MFLTGANRYTEIRPIDSGSFGTVVLSRDKLTGEDVAIKKIERGPNVDKHVLNEIRNHRRLHHEHIIKFKDCYLTQTHLCIVMEYAVGGNLKMYIKDFKGLDENTARWFFQQLMLALQYCHKMRVANRDIKLDNLLLDATDEWPMLKMCDFGYSKDEEMNSAPHSTVGTPLYLAPEVIMKEPDDIYDGKKSDIWSCGVVLYAMIFNCYPFVKREDLASHCVFVRIAKKVCENPLSFPTNTEASEDVRDLLTKMLEKDPERRITLDEILEHRWFRLRLPEGALDMNNEVECQDYRLQSDAKINTLIEEAKIPYCIENEDLIQHFS